MSGEERSLTETSVRRRILLIDDDPLQYTHLKDLFRRFREKIYDLDWAHSFGEGLVLLLSGNYDACLLDYNLGESTGIELLQQAAAANCQTPVILVTGFADDTVDLEALNAGAVDYLSKEELNPRTIERSVKYAVRMGQTLQALRNAADHDEVTGLLNRHALEELLTDESERARRFCRPFSVVLVDLDHFKCVNDTHGHLTGDAVLRHVAGLLLANIRSIDRVARYGGEEFAVVLIETGLGTALDVAERIRLSAEKSPFPGLGKGIPIPVTLSAGVAEFPSHGSSAKGLIGAADQALYQAKAQGRNRVVAAQAPAGSPAPSENPLRGE